MLGLCYIDCITTTFCDFEQYLVEQHGSDGSRRILLEVMDL